MPIDNKHFSLHGPESRAVPPPLWLVRFANLVTRAFHSAEQLPPVGCHFHRNEEEGDLSAEWEVTLFTSSTEVFGGALDGSCSAARFMLDLKVLIEAFDAIESLYWQAQTMADDDEVGPHVGVEGSFEGHAVWLRITAEPPSQFESGRVFDACEDEIHDRW